MRRSPFSLAVLLLSLASVARAGSADEHMLLKLDHDNTVATWTADSRWFDEHLADDFMQVTINGTIKTKVDVVRELASPGFSMEPYEPTEVQVRIYGDTAIVTGRVFQRFARNGMNFAIDARYTDVYTKRRGKWLLVTSHASPISKSRNTR
jgi:hypothetical protein